MSEQRGPNVWIDPTLVCDECPDLRAEIARLQRERDGHLAASRTALAVLKDKQDLVSQLERQLTAARAGAREEALDGINGDYRSALVGVAAQLVAEMECDNSCRFFVKAGQAKQLNEICARAPLLTMPLSHLATLASGEHSEQEQLLAAYGHEQIDVRDAHKLLNDIFENTEEPQLAARPAGAHEHEFIHYGGETFCRWCNARPAREGGEKT